MNFAKERKNISLKDNKEFTNLTIKKRKKLTFNSLSNFENRFNLRMKKTSNISTFFNFTETFKIKKSNNLLLKNILDKKINEKNKNIFKSFFEKKKKNYKSYLSRIDNKSSIISSTTYTNPFITTYKHKRKCNIYNLK